MALFLHRPDPVNAAWVSSLCRDFPGGDIARLRIDIAALLATGALGEGDRKLAIAALSALEDAEASVSALGTALRRF